MAETGQTSISSSVARPKDNIADLLNPRAGFAACSELSVKVVQPCFVVGRASPVNCSIMKSVALSNSSMKNLRKLTMSRTVDELFPRSWRTNSTNSANDISSFLLNKWKSAISTRPATSTSTLFNNRQASGFSKMSPTSHLDNIALQSLSRLSSNARSSVFTKLMVLASFSTAATALTPSTITPINMFITPKVPTTTNAMNSAAKATCSSPMLYTTSAESGSNPGNKSVDMLSKSVPKYISSKGWPLVRILNATAKT
mmetsp:Transcript_77673/g.225401  ORF Transcript_77673/g.225401 Transcript_77673/m.225401 type:complete len:257 (-) Transcript_77673:1720-2490(-)